MNINLIFDQAVGSLPAGFVASLNAVVQYLDNHFNNPVTINIHVGYGQINGQPLFPGALGESETFLNQYSYSAVRNALIANAGSPDQISAVNNLPVTDPSPGGTGHYWVSTAEAKAIGLSGASSATDGFIGFSNTNSFTYNTVNGGSVASGTYDFFGVAAHEITEVLGRALLVGGSIGGVSNSFEPMDLFHYATSNHNRTFSGTTAGYFSPDGGVTNLDDFNTNPNGDFGDWAASAGHDAFLAFSSSGVANLVTDADLRVMNVLGYDEPPPPPKGLVGDFNHDGHSDLLWQASNGHPTEWLMNQTNITTSQGLVNPGPSWHAIAANGDFDGDLNSDILWQNADGAPAIWELNGTSIIGGGLLLNPGPSWHAIAAGDFNQDGKADILWQNVDGAAAIWEMNGTTIIGGGLVSPNPGPSWHAVATGDFNADGKADILWQNTDGAAAIWEMNGTAIIGGGLVPVNPGSSWHLVGTADFNADGRSDFIWQNTDGTPAIWEMNGTSIIGGALLPNPGAAWQLIGAGNYATPQPDLVFLNTSTNAVQVWAMNGLNVSSMQPVATPAPSTAQPDASVLATPLNATPVLYDNDEHGSPPDTSSALAFNQTTNPLFAHT